MAFWRRATMKYFLILLSVTLLLMTCQTRKTDDQQLIDKSQILLSDTSVIAILPYDTSRHWIFSDCEQSSISAKEMDEIEVILKQFVDDYNINKETQINLTRYKRQYIAVTNRNDQKEVWINFFCNQGSRNWKEELVIVKDGGNCYFNLKVNLATRTFYDLIVNGEA